MYFCTEGGFVGSIFSYEPRDRASRRSARQFFRLNSIKVSYGRSGKEKTAYAGLVKCVYF